MTVPVIASSTTAGPTSTASLSINKPSGVASGDLLVCFAAIKTYAAADDYDATITGFTQRGTRAASQSGTSNIFLRLLDRVADGSEGASFSVALTPGGSDCCAAMFRITGAHATAPYDTSSFWENDAHTEDRTFATLTTAEPDELLIGALGSWAATVGTLSGYTVEVDNLGAGTTWPAMDVQSKSRASAGVESATTLTETGTWTIVGTVLGAYKQASTAAARIPLGRHVPGTVAQANVVRR